MLLTLQRSAFAQSFARNQVGQQHHKKQVDARKVKVPREGIEGVADGSSSGFALSAEQLLARRRNVPALGFARVSDQISSGKTSARLRLR